MFAAIGDCGNIIYADPLKSISVGVSGTFKPTIYSDSPLIAFLENTALTSTIEPCSGGVTVKIFA